MIAYFILVHRYPSQFKRLFKAIYDPSNHYLIHVDHSAQSGLYQEVRTFLADFPNSSLLKSQNIVWGGYSMVEAELRGMKKLLKLSLNWDFFINLSGQDFPLKPQSEIKAFLKKNIGKDFMLVSDQVKVRPNTLNRIKNYFTEKGNGFTGRPFRRAYLNNVIPYIGGQWKILSREACELICVSPKVNRFKKYYKNTLIPDESFFQTVLMNIGLIKNIIRDDKRAIIWIPDLVIKLLPKNFKIEDTDSLIKSGKIKLRPKIFTTQDLRFLTKSNAFFARKFDETVDAKILDMMEARLSDMSPVRSAKREIIDVVPLQNPLTISPAIIT